MAHTVDKKAAVMAALLTGQGVAEVSAEFQVAERTVYDWAKELGGMDALRSGRLHDLLYKYTATNLETLEIQSRFARSTEWLQGQDASAFAVMHGVLADKTIRILAAIERASESAGD